MPIPETIEPGCLESCAVWGDATDTLTQRVFPAPGRVYRTAFQRDRDRVVQARAFRRLAGKTQVFTQGGSDHFRSRLTHTIEVAQIARGIASALGLNEDLAETLALVHDIGHPPFGHAGERALDDCLRRHGLRFDHNLHALRIVEHFELRYAAHRGLNLTLAVREGIIKHSRDYSPAQHPELSEYFLDQRPPLEAQIIDLADEIAYLAADIDDGIESGMLSLEDVCANVRIIQRNYLRLQREHAGTDPKFLFNEALLLMTHALTEDLIHQTATNTLDVGITCLQGVRTHPERLAVFSPWIEAERQQGKKYLYETLYTNEHLTREHVRSVQVITEMFDLLMREPERLPASHFALVREEGRARVVADYIAGMTDTFILNLHQAML